ncbi:somatostatin 2 [Trichomycterus rosablanca]|uniref:somatostatin 2 n=1 Tax=Trichomycterus rosablanca TaxID=2290929 RepID=UPI002F356CBE
MACSPLALMCLVAAVGVVSCGRPHVLLNSALENPQAGPTGEEVPDRLTLQELQWMLSNDELVPPQVDEVPPRRMELVRRQNTVTTKPVNCMNYFWKSRTAC